MFYLYSSAEPLLEEGRTAIVTDGTDGGSSPP
jgi:hypothetical protein